MDRIVQRVRDEFLNGWQFDSLLEAEVLIEDWRVDYNMNRPQRHLAAYEPPSAASITSAAASDIDGVKWLYTARVEPGVAWPSTGLAIPGFTLAAINLVATLVANIVESHVVGEPGLLRDPLEAV